MKLRLNVWIPGIVHRASLESFKQPNFGSQSVWSAKDLRGKLAYEPAAAYL